MTSILVGIDGSASCRSALNWAAHRASRLSCDLALLTVVDPDAMRQAGANEETARAAAEKLLHEEADVVIGRFPNLNVSVNVAKGKAVDALVDAADEHDLVVLGTHHGSNLSAALGAATGLRVSVSSPVPTAVIPADWEQDCGRMGVLVGIGPDDVSEPAVAFGAEEALELGQPLDLVSVWGLPPLLTRPAEAMGGGLAPVGEQRQRELDERVLDVRGRFPGLDVYGHAIESSSPARGLVERGSRYALLVLGTHSRNVLGRALFGSVTHGVLMSAGVPVIIVPA